MSRPAASGAEALASLDRALAIKPDYADALANRGNALIDLGRAEEALASYDKALAINPALAHGAEALSPGKRTLRSKSPVNIWYSKLH